MVWHSVVTTCNQSSHYKTRTPGQVHTSSMPLCGPAGDSPKIPSLKLAMMLTGFRDCNGGALLTHTYFASRTNFRTKVYLRCLRVK